MDVEIEVAHGEMAQYDFDAPLSTYLSPVNGEMLTTPPNLDSFVQKTVVDLEIGREEVPLLYTPVYRRIEDPNLTQNVDVRSIASSANVVFLDHIEGGEVRFGTRVLVPGQTVPIITYVAGFEYTEDMVEYDKTWEVTQLNEGFGRGYNALLNHLHLYPILSYVYTSKNQTAAYTTSTEYRVNIRTTIRNALVHASQDRNTDTGIARAPSVLIAHSSRRWDLEEAMARFNFAGTDYPPLAGIDTMIFYDGYAITVGKKTYNYAGCATNKAYLVDPSTYLVELVKHDLRVDAAPGDLSRLVAQEIVGRARRGVFCSPPNSVEEVTLP